MKKLALLILQKSLPNRKISFYETGLDEDLLLNTFLQLSNKLLGITVSNRHIFWVKKKGNNLKVEEEENKAESRAEIDSWREALKLRRRATFSLCRGMGRGTQASRTEEAVRVPGFPHANYHRGHYNNPLVEREWEIPTLWGQTVRKGHTKPLPSLASSYYVPLGLWWDPKGNTTQGSGRLRALSHKTRNALAVKMESLTHTKSASQFAYYLQ